MRNKSSVLKRIPVRLARLLAVLLFLSSFGSCAPRFARTKDGRTLWRIGTEIAPSALQPYAATATSAELLFPLLYDTLFDRILESGEYAPSLCTGYTISPTADGAFRWDVSLRPDVLWQDGTALTSEDVAFSLQSQSDFSRAYAFSDCTVLNAVGIDVQDPTHLAFIAFEEESAVLVALSRIPILPKSVWNAPEYMSYDYRGLAANYKVAYGQLYTVAATAETMLGSGPYRFAGCSGHVCVLTRNENYWGDKGRTQVVEIHFALSDAQEALEKGQIEEAA